jgi:hypothetical protein
MPENSFLAAQVDSQIHPNPSLLLMHHEDANFYPTTGDTSFRKVLQERVQIRAGKVASPGSTPE